MGYVEVRELVKDYGRVRAVHGVSLDVEQHEIVALLGPSGCGKTTTLRCLAGLETPSSGEIVIGGQLLFSAQANVPPESRDIGMVFQSYALWPHMTVARNVAYGLEMRHRPQAEIRKRVSEMLALVGLEGLEGRYPSELSGGQQQRVALARSLAARPRVLLFDEPLSNLDAKLREHMRIELKDLIKATGITSIYVTHDQAEAMAISDRIALMEAGRIVQLGDPRDLYERPASAFVAEFLGSVNFLRAELASQDRAPSGLTRAVFGEGQEIFFPTPRIPAGRTVVLGLRPEHIRVSGTATRNSNCWPALVTKRVYMGSVLQIFARIGLTELRVQSSLEDFAEGDKVFLGIEPARVIHVPAQD